MEKDTSLLTRQEAARRLGVSLYLIDQMVKLGTLDHVKLGRRVGIPSDSVDGWIDKNRSRRESNNV